MQIFVTGGTGTVGSAFITSLLRRGGGSSTTPYTIRALARSSTSAQKISAMGATPVQGEITDLSLLTKEASNADAVVYCAFDNASTNREEEAALEKAAITAVCEGLSPSSSSATTTTTRKFLMYCVGLSSLAGAKNVTETTPMPEKGSPRAATNAIVEAYASGSPPQGNGIRAVQLRLAYLTHSNKYPHPFLNFFKGPDGVFQYYKDGSNQWTAADGADVGELAASVIESQDKIPSGKVAAVHAFGERISTKEIADILGKQSGKGTKSFGDEELGKLQGLPKIILPASIDISNEWTRKKFGWEPKGKKLAQQIKDAKWFTE